MKHAELWRLTARLRSQANAWHVAAHDPTDRSCALPRAEREYYAHEFAARAELAAAYRDRAPR